MPGFRFTDAETDELIAVIKAFAPAAFTSPAAPVALGPPPAPNATRGAALWSTLGCSTCHGPGGHGDGPAAKTMIEPPYDLVAFPVRRPRADADLRRATALSIATGLAGTPMPGFAGAVPDADLWALADHVVALGARTTQRDRAAIDDREIGADRTAKIVAGTWPGPSGDPDAALFGTAIPAQGPPPAGLAPALAALAPAACARCHPQQQAEWSTSIHGGAASPGLIAQLDFGLAPAESASCRRCHTPLDEQRADLALRSTGVSCAGCHLRGYTRHGPPNVSPALAPIAGYPLVTQTIYERADFCLPCHQLPPRTAVNGKPLLNTYKEWLEGPFPARGVACQDCHMPKRAHLWRGVHDRDMFRQAIDLDATASRSGDTVTVVATLRNRGAGHDVPTTATPGAWLSIELLDARGAAIPGATSSLRIGRDVYYDGTWHERADTRIPPGGRAVMARAWTTVGATQVRLTLEVRPDELYESIYASRLRASQPPQARALYERALAHATSTHYLAEQRVMRIETR
jgi:mono/diheme cytochrome c family protein